MRVPAIASPKSGRELVDTYFIENRTRVLEVAAFLDRLDRAAGGDALRDAEGDFRVRVLREALGVLAEGGAGEASRVERIQMLLSDPGTELLPRADRKSAHGAYDRWQDDRWRDDHRQSEGV